MGWWGGGARHDNLWKLVWRVNIFSAPEKGRTSQKHAHQNNATVLPLLKFMTGPLATSLPKQWYVKLLEIVNQYRLTLFAFPDVFVQDRDGSKVT